MNILEKIYESTLKFLASSTPEEVYERIVNEAIQVVNVDEGAIYLKDGDNFKAVYATQPYVYNITPRKSGNTNKAFLTRKTIIANVNKSHPELNKDKIKSSIFIPLSYESKSIGVLTLDSKKKEYFDKKKKNTLILFGSLASLAIKKAQLYNEVKQAADVRDLFISLAAHELRTPLTSVNGYIQLLKTRIKNRKKIPSKWVMELEMESNRLKQLVEEFLEINSIRTGKIQFDFKEASLSKIIKRSISVFGFNKPERKIVFKNKLNSPKDTVIGDQNKLTQVIVNVFENADKYSYPDKKILITLESKDSSYMINIADRGRGIAKEDLPKIFKGFYKGKDSLHEGMGLGLYLSKLIIDRHNGIINISSKLNEGTKVVVVLPRSELIN
ncbi:MAG TPA: GAF domain-containing sensor histidine kinase [Patescibacteria group bacterium]|nr:GAF domain-containing sensor histidine kinase [Patescibacteria group bacterium]